MTRAVQGGNYLQGFGLACALGVGLANCLQSMRLGKPRPGRINLSTTSSAPYFSIPSADLPVFDAGLPHEQWTARAQFLLRAVLSECLAANAGPLPAETPLFIATSSLNVGRLEAGEPVGPDGQEIVETIATWLNWSGPVFWMSTACTSSANALISADRYVASGQSSHAVVLGLELYNEFSTEGFHGMQLLTENLPLPLDAQRSGFVLGEAVAAVLLSKQAARWRLLGVSNQVSAANPLGADAQALAQVANQALEVAGINPEQINLVKLQAVGSEQNDAVEIDALNQVFDKLPALTTLKTYLGHTLGACAAAELALLVACLEEQYCPDASAPNPDPLLGAECCTVLPRPCTRVLMNTLGFGGGHTCLLLEDLQPS